jgi:predicted metal-binding membrane protein
MTPTWTLRLLRWSYCAFIAWASAQTFLSALGAHDLHAKLLSGVEMAAITALLFPPIELVAAAVLLIVYAIASVLTVLSGEPPVRFVFYGVTALYIVWASRLAGPTSVATAQA